MAIHVTRRQRTLQKKHKKIYRIRNWHTYNNSLIARGSVTLWISPDILRTWRHRGRQTRGHPLWYGSNAILCLLTLRAVFRLTLRSTQGFAGSIFALMHLPLPVPDYTTLCRRAAGLSVSLPRSGSRHIDIVMDSTGLKLHGEGEWKTKIHDTRKRRQWYKLHIAVNPDNQEIEASVLTGRDGVDWDQSEPMLAQIDAEIGTAAADGSYDKQPTYDALKKRKVRPVIPPQKNAKITQHGNCHGPPLPRDEAIRRIRAVGRKRWKAESGYHARSLAETAMFRLKTIFGDHASHRRPERQRTDARIRCRALNIMTQLGMPDSVRVS